MFGYDATFFYDKMPSWRSCHLEAHFYMKMRQTPSFLLFLKKKQVVCTKEKGEMTENSLENFRSSHLFHPLILIKNRVKNSVLSLFSG